MSDWHVVGKIAFLQAQVNTLKEQLRETNCRIDKLEEHLKKENNAYLYHQNKEGQPVFLR